MKEEFKVTSLDNNNERKINIKESKMKNNQRIITTGLIVALIFVVGYFFVLPKLGNPPNNKQITSSSSSINENSWQAIFLSNGQVYFGHLKDVSGQFITLSEIYYLQLEKPLQSTDPRDKLKETEDSARKLQLIKLGKELHGPTDSMVINRDHILFYEELSSDSKVVTAIDKSKKEQEKE